jgi:hypothetical protein
MLSKVHFHVRHNLTVPATMAAALLFAFPSVAGASHTSAGGPPNDFAVGNGTFETDFNFRFHATSGPLGENPSGTMFLEGPGFSIEAEVTCLAVAAVVGVTQGTLIGNRTGGTGLPLVTSVEFTFTDTGPMMQDTFAATFNTTVCLPSGGGTPISRGQIIAHDGQP